jgi:uncharacterized membrane protein
MPDGDHPIHGSERAVTTPTSWFRARLWLVDALWFPVLLANFTAIAMAMLLPELDKQIGSSDRLPLTLSSVQSIFSSMAGGMITFTGIVFSAIFIAAQIQTSSYSPRLAARLRRDPVIVGALALSSATATYALFALAAIGRSSFVQNNGNSVPAATVLVGLILAVATLFQFAHLVQRAFESIQIGGILRSLAKNGRRVIDDVHPHPDSGAATAETTPPSGEQVATVQHAGKAGVIAAIDRRALVKVATSVGGIVEVVPQVGEFVSPRTTVLKVYGGSRALTEREATSIFVLARQRTIDQDPAFVLRMFVDIAIRALSPAINDPTTAVQVLDRIEAMLVELYERHPGPAYVADDNGAVRGYVHAPRWLDYFELGSTEIRRFGSSSMQVHRRLRAMHEHLLHIVGGPERDRILMELQMIEETASAVFEHPHELAIARQPDRVGIGGAR